MDDASNRLRLGKREKGALSGRIYFSLGAKNIKQTTAWNYYIGRSVSKRKMPKAGDNKLYITHTPHRLHVSLSSSSSTLPTQYSTAQHNTTKHLHVLIKNPYESWVLRLFWLSAQADERQGQLSWCHTHLPLSMCASKHLISHCLRLPLPVFHCFPCEPSSSLLYMYQLYIMTFRFYTHKYRHSYKHIYISRYVCISRIASSNTHKHSPTHILTHSHVLY